MFLKGHFFVDNLTYPIGTNVVIPIYLLGHDPENYPEPEVFRPERFAAHTQNTDRNPYAYIPFSAGPRNCIGQKFVMLEMKSLISQILLHYEISLAEDSQNYPALYSQMVLMPAQKLHFHVKLRG